MTRVHWCGMEVQQAVQLHSQQSIDRVVEKVVECAGSPSLPDKSRLVIGILLPFFDSDRVVHLQEASPILLESCQNPMAGVLLFRVLLPSS